MVCGGKGDLQQLAVLHEQYSNQCIMSVMSEWDTKFLIKFPFILGSTELSETAHFTAYRTEAKYIQAFDKV